MFGALAERAGRPETVFEMPEGATAGDVLGTVADRYPATADVLSHVKVAVNLELAFPSQALADDDEVALLPPVAGGSGTLPARILAGLREGVVPVGEALEAVQSPDAGGTVLFLGTVRNNAGEWGEVERLEYSVYPEMAERVLGQIAEEAATKWPLTGVAILHGFGTLKVGDPTIVVACSAPHRGAAFDAARYAIDEVKIRVPVWKKERGPGGDRWIGLETRRGAADGRAR
jgi:molybdopterin synthase catalytic subunit/molybdopterin converting factor small subunit